MRVGNLVRLPRHLHAPTTPAPAATTGDCSGSQVCVEGSCQDVGQTCQFNRECAPGTVCLNNGCTRICSGDADCVAGDSCQGGFCQPNPNECTVSTDCPSGDHCVSGRCLANCTSDAQCGTDLYCATDGFCRPAWQSEPFCSQDSDCNTGRVCRSGVCRTPCPTMTNAQCMSFDSQVPDCQQDPASGDYLCVAANEVSPQCRVQTDCSSTQNCVDGACRNR